MSVTQNPLIGRARQKLGGTVFTTWKGINVIKGKPLSVANPKTDLQLMRRSAMRQIVAIARTISAAMNFGFKEQAVRKSAFNAFISFNLKNAFDYSSPPDATLILNNFLVSQGTISKTDILTQVASAGAKTIVTTFSALASLPGQSAADKIYGAVYNDMSDEWISLSSSAVRSDGTATFNTPTGYMSIGNDVIGYFFFYNSSTRKSSDSYKINSTVGA